MKPDGKKVPEPTRVEQIRLKHLEPGALSLVVFGPGHGESMIVVLPDGAVGVVDGCREPKESDPVHGFLEEAKGARSGGTDPFRLEFLCLTHPHEDHYRGLGRLLKDFQGSLKHVWRVLDVGDRYFNAIKEYLTHMRKASGLLPGPDDMDDLSALTRIIAEMREAHQTRSTEFKYLGQSKTLLKRTCHGEALTLSGCGPADQDVETALLNLCGWLEDARAGKALRKFDPNAASGALLLRWGKAGVLLGGDLLSGDNEYGGWEAVHKEIDSPVQVIKAAHHASEGAHHEALWKRLNPHLTIVTPFQHAKGEQPPRPKRIAHLAETSVVAITSKPDWPPHPQGPSPLYSQKPVEQEPVKQEPVQKRRTTSAPRSTLAGATPGVAVKDTKNAVAVSLDKEGRVTRFVLAGQADVYERR